MARTLRRTLPVRPTGVVTCTVQSCSRPGAELGSPAAVRAEAAAKWEPEMPGRGARRNARVSMKVPARYRVGSCEHADRASGALHESAFQPRVAVANVAAPLAGKDMADFDRGASRSAIACPSQLPQGVARG